MGQFISRRHTQWLEIIQRWPLTHLTQWLNDSSEGNVTVTEEQIVAIWNREQVVSLPLACEPGLDRFFATVMPDEVPSKRLHIRKQGNHPQVELNQGQVYELRRVLMVYLNFYELMAAAVKREMADPELLQAEFGPVLQHAEYVKLLMKNYPGSFPYLPSFLASLPKS